MGRQMRSVLTFLVLFTFPILAAPDSDQPTPQRAFCHLLKACELEDASGTCTEKLSADIPGVSHDQTYCGWVRSFARRGIVPGTYETNEMYRYMGGKFHVTYVVSDTLPIPFPALDLLLDNVSLTSRMINSYRGTSYSAEYPLRDDSTFFKGTNGRSLSGQARQVWMRTDRRERIYYGQGRVTVMKWAMVGNVVIELRAWPLAKDRTKAVYNARFTMFPANSMINAVMNMGVFRSVAIGKIQEVLNDIQFSANAYSQGAPVLQQVEYTPAEQAQLEEFNRLFRQSREASAP